MGRRWDARLTPRPRRRSAARVLGRDLTTAAAALMRDDIHDAASRGVDAHEQQLGTYRDLRRRGERITLRRTGQLLDTIRAHATAAEATVAPRARHARHVLRRFQLFELGRHSLERLEGLAARHFNDFIERHSEGT